MAGEALTDSFLLSSATVMIGPQADLWKLNPSNSIGLVKNFSINAQPTYTELTQGVKNQIVFSVLTDMKVSATMEVYEYTAKNIAYGLGLDGSGIASIATNHTLKTAITGADSVVPIVIDAASDNSTDFPVGSWLVLQEKGGTDQVFVAKVVSATYAAGTSDTTIVVDRAVATGMTFSAGANVSKSNLIKIGSRDEQPFLAAKVVGILPKNNEPCTIMIPKLRITKGFTLAFQTNAYGNLPFEFTPYQLVSTDPNFSDFSSGEVAQIFDRL